jgi:excisionase family DNA binding protein
VSAKIEHPKSPKSKYFISPEMQSLQQSLPGLLTVAETALFLKVSRPTVDRLARDDKEFPAPIKFGATCRYSRDAILEYLSRKQTRVPIASRQPKAAR